MLEDGIGNGRFWTGTENMDLENHKQELEPTINQWVAQIIQMLPVTTEELLRRELDGHSFQGQRVANGILSITQACAFGGLHAPIVPQALLKTFAAIGPKSVDVLDVSTRDIVGL